MNCEQVKERLQKLHQTTIDYTVVFSGKKSGKAYGLYRPATREIIIHDKNFADEDGGLNENLLMFTAIHELAHHVMMAEKGDTSIRCHNQDFWATFHGLLDTAEKCGVYRAAIDADTQKLIDEARDISVRIAELQRELGRVICAIDASCRKNGLREEDIIERKAQIGRQTSKAAVAAFNMGDTGVGFDIQAEAVKQRGEERQEAVIAAAKNGASVIQAKKAAAPSKPDEDESAKLAIEKRRIERTIESLEHRLQKIKQELCALGKYGDGI
jgi:hypothetical protein